MQKYFIYIVLATLTIVAIGHANGAYEILYDDWYTVGARKHVFKIIKFGEPEVAEYDYYYLVGKIYTKKYYVNCYILTPDEYEIYLSGETPTTAQLWQTENGFITVEVPLEFGKKYYLILDNSMSMMTDKEVLVFLVATYW